MHCTKRNSIILEHPNPHYFIFVNNRFFLSHKYSELHREYLVEEYHNVKILRVLW